MGHQLWTSPITGYRRTGTRLAELRSLIDSGITGRAILEPLLSCPSSAPALEAARLLRRREFDLAGVKKRKDAPVTGFVLADSLTAGHVEDHARPISAEHLISDGTPLSEVLHTLKGRPHTFVLVGAQVAGIIARADLNKPPVRIYLFSLISLLEMHLGFWVKAEYPDDSWQSALTPNRLTAAERIQADRRKRNQDPVLVDCLQFCDKRDLVTAKDKLLKQLELGTKAKAIRFLKRAEDLRNVLAHGQHDLADGVSWEEMIDLAAWIERAVHASDTKVEERAASHARKFEDELWAAA